MPDMRVLIAGGGIGGLAAAAACAKHDLEPIVLEQAPEIGEVGAGLGLTPPAMKGLDYLGCEDRVRELGVLCYRWSDFNLETGELRGFIDQRALADQYGKPWYVIYRPDLIDALLTSVPEGAIQVGSRVVDFEETADEVRVELENGRELRGDVLIGADGLKSVVRERLFGPQEPRFTGFAAFRGIIPLPIPGATRDWSLPEKWTYHGSTGGFHAYAVRKNTVLNFVATMLASDAGGETRESWELRGDVEQLRRALRNACEDVRLAVAAATETFVTAFYDRPALDTWGTARVSLLGDAAHPTLPALGSGSAMCIEDAVALGHCLAKHGRSDVASGLAEYEERRKPRTTKVLVQGRHSLGVRAQMDRDPEYKAAEQGRLTGLARLDPEGKTANYILPGWLWGFDPVKALDLPPEELRTASWVVANPLQRQEARRAFDLWRSALAYDELPTWRTQREGYERFSEREFPVSAAIRTEEIDCNGVPALRVEGGEGPVVLHLHGGGYVLGSARGAVELAARLAGSVGGSALVVDYRLAPKHGFPAALEDALAVYRYLVGEVGAGRVIVTGEDAGGGLAVSLACAARDAGDPLPMAVYVVSPFCDLSLSSASIDASRGADPWLNRDFLTHLAACYIQATDPEDPRVSPVYADLSGLPPLLIHAAAGEALVDDARRLAESAQAAGVETTLTLFEDTVHSFVLFEFLPETRQALAALGKLTHRSAPASVDI